MQSNGMLETCRLIWEENIAQKVLQQDSGLSGYAVYMTIGGHMNERMPVVEHR